MQGVAGQGQRPRDLARRRLRAGPRRRAARGSRAEATGPPELVSRWCCGGRARGRQGRGRGAREEKQGSASGDGAMSGARGEENGEEVLARGRQGVWRRRTGSNSGSSCSNPTAEGGTGLQASGGEEVPWRKEAG